MELNIKWRNWFKGLPPRPIKLEIPGWAGENNWDHGQPWHCKPFKDGSTYGLELIYPFDTEVTVTTRDGNLVWTGDFTEEKGQQPWDRPFSSFAPHHFGFTSSLDIQTEIGYGTMILPHPRIYTDRTGTAPLAVGGMIESDFWPRVFFIVFKSPLEGQTYVFRKGEGYAQILVVPKKVKYKIDRMTAEEEKTRAAMEQTLDRHRTDVATRTWKTVSKDEFDNKYKILSGVAATGGPQAVQNHLANIASGHQDETVRKQETARKMFPRKVI